MTIRCDHALFSRGAQSSPPWKVDELLRPCSRRYQHLDGQLQRKFPPVARDSDKNTSHRRYGVAKTGGAGLHCRIVGSRCGELSVSGTEATF